MNRLDDFKREMAEAGFQIDPITDGQIHRFQTWGDATGEMSGAYWHNGSVGWFQDWRTMEKPKVVKGKLSKADQEALNGSFSSANNKVSREALEAGIRRIWNAGTEPDGGHPYLRKKGITAPSGRVKQYEGCLIAPVFSVNKEINGLQRIDADGRKRFLAGSRKQGSFFSIPGNGTYLICEGFATGVSLHEATGSSIVVAFDAGNLSHVARAISKKVDPKNIILAGDNDAWKSEVGQKNVGGDMAKRAAQEIGARCVLPKFQRPDGKKTTDWNDLHRVEGLETVKKQILNVPPIYEFISLDEIANVEIQDNPVIEGLLEEKGSLIIVAASGVGKSIISNQIAMVCGNPPECGLWNLFKIPKRVTSLIVQSENSMGAINRRVRKVNANPALREGARNVFMLKVNEDVRLSGCLTDLSFQSLLVDRLNELEAKLLILDPLVSYHDEDENDNAGMRTVLDCVTSICDQTGASVIICHHFNRQDTTRGAAAIRDWAANFLLLNFEKKTEGSTIFRCVHDKSRNYETQPDFYLERTANLEFLRCEKPGKQSQQIDAVVTALTTMGGHVDSQTALKNAVMVELDCSEATARRAIDEGLKMKKIIIIPGKGKGHPNSYKLPD